MPEPKGVGSASSGEECRLFRLHGVSPVPIGFDEACIR